jgi:hypothetical protein
MDKEGEDFSAPFRLRSFCFYAGKDSICAEAAYQVEGHAEGDCRRGTERSVLRPPDNGSAVNLSQNPIAAREVFDDEISSRASHGFFRTFQPGLLLAFVQLFPTDGIKPKEIASSCKPDSPHSSIFTFFDVADRIADLHA